MNTTSTSQVTSAAQAIRNWRSVAWISALFSLIVGVAILFSYATAKSEDPLHSLKLKEYKEKLRLSPTDENLKQSIRALDFELRSRYFTHIQRVETGVYLLFLGTAVFIVSAVRLRNATKKPPMPGQPSTADHSLHDSVLARWSVTGSAALVAMLLLTLGFASTTAVPRREADVEKALGTAKPQPKAADTANPEEMARNWPRFLGANAGASPVINVPTQWDVKTGAGIAWKTEAAIPGFGSPIIWGDRVFYSGGDAAKREVICLDLKTGKQVWRQPLTNVQGSSKEEAEIPESTGYAAPTMATDGRRIYVVYANGEVGAFTLQGQLLWAKNFGPLKNPYGHATSLATWRDRLILQLDQGEAEDNKSKLYALDGQTGQIVWQRPRKAGGSWSTPVVFEAGGKTQIVALAVPFAIGYDAADGTELWKVDCLNGEVTPSPIFAGGVLIVPSPSDRMMAIRPDGKGDVTKTHVAWTFEENVPDVTSPASDGKYLFTVSSGGFLTCLDLKEGKRLWEHDLEMECHASPVIAGGKVYLFSQKGRAVVVEASPEYKEVFRTEMGDPIHATPAFSPAGMVVRGVSNIWCVVQGAAPGGESK